MKPKKRRFFSIVLILVLASCEMKNGETAATPLNILSEDQMADVLADYALAESAANLNIKNVSLAKMDTVYAFDILKFRGYRMSQYDSSLRFYSEHPKLYKAVYEKTLVKLTELESEVTAVKTDSVSK
jgi:PhoPQ-activated pathogenicity-related protein